MDLSEVPVDMPFWDGEGLKNDLRGRAGGRSWRIARDRFEDENIPANGGSRQVENSIQAPAVRHSTTVPPS